MLDDHTRKLLEGPNYVHVATLMPDGAPHSVAMWGGVDGDRVIIFTGSPATQKARNLAADGRVAISVTDYRNPYRTAQLRGRVAETRHGAEALAVMDELSQKYTGAPFPWRTEEGTLYLIDVDWSRFSELPFTHAPAQG